MNNIKISIIIPAYNAEKYIINCINAILKQTLREIEIIVVNDGSTDNTALILNTLSAQHTMLRVIHQTNQSVGAARTKGVLSAIGEYIAFADSDDTMQPIMLQTMYENAKQNNSDIVVCGYNDVDTNQKVIKIHAFEQQQVNFIGSLLLKINPATWNKIYKRELFIQNKIKFTPNIFCEDLATTLELFYFASKTTYVDKALYNYLLNPQGASLSITQKNIDHIFMALEKNKKFLLEHSLLEQYNLEFHKRIYLQMQYINKQIKATNTTNNKELRKYFFQKMVSSELVQINKESLKKIFSKDQYVYFKCLAYEIYKMRIESVYIYGYGESFKELEMILNFLNITIDGIIETQDKQRNLPYQYGTLEKFKDRLSNKTIFIISHDNFEAIQSNIQSFSHQNNIKIQIF